MIAFVDLLGVVIDEGIAAARQSYARPDQAHKLQGSIAGFEACRNLDAMALDALLLTERAASDELYRSRAGDDEFWTQRCKVAEIEWTANVMSAALMNTGLPVIVSPSARGVLCADRCLKILASKSQGKGGRGSHVEGQDVDQSGRVPAEPQPQAPQVAAQDKRATDLCVCGVARDKHRFFNSETLGPCDNFVPHPQARGGETAAAGENTGAPKGGLSTPSSPPSVLLPEEPKTRQGESLSGLMQQAAARATNDAIAKLSEFDTWPDRSSNPDDELPTWAHLHDQALVRHFDEPWSRVECSCGHKGVWLRDDWRCQPCPRTGEAAKLHFAITVAGWGTLFATGTSAQAETWRKHKAIWEMAVAHKRIATAAEKASEKFEDLTRLIG